MAVGRLKSIWNDLPDEIVDIKSLAGEFEKFFGCRWDDVMFGAREPFTYHEYWEAYIAVEGLSPHPGDLTITSLFAIAGGTTACYNIILG